MMNAALDPGIWKIASLKMGARMGGFAALASVIMSLIIDQVLKAPAAKSAGPQASLGPGGGIPGMMGMAPRGIAAASLAGFAAEAKGDLLGGYKPSQTTIDLRKELAELVREFRKLLEGARGGAPGSLALPAVPQIGGAGGAGMSPFGVRGVQGGEYRFLERAPGQGTIEKYLARLVQLAENQAKEGAAQKAGDQMNVGRPYLQVQMHEVG